MEAHLFTQLPITGGLNKLGMEALKCEEPEALKFLEFEAWRAWVFFEPLFGVNTSEFEIICFQAGLIIKPFSSAISGIDKFLSLLLLPLSATISYNM